jgi:hypothetical protein
MCHLTVEVLIIKNVARKSIVCSACQVHNSTQVLGPMGACEMNYGDSRKNFIIAGISVFYVISQSIDIDSPELLTQSFSEEWRLLGCYAVWHL